VTCFGLSATSATFRDNMPSLIASPKALRRITWASWAVLEALMLVCITLTSCAVNLSKRLEPMWGLMCRRIVRA
jgi:hypothetical protein